MPVEETLKALTVCGSCWLLVTILKSTVSVVVRSRVYCLGIAVKDAVKDLDESLDAQYKGTTLGDLTGNQTKFPGNTRYLRALNQHTRSFPCTRHYKMVTYFELPTSLHLMFNVIARL